MYLQRKIVLRVLGAILAVVVATGTSAPAQTKKTDKQKSSQKQEQTSQKVDLNTASEKDLDALPGVGPATAKKIIAHRPYSSVDDLKKAGVSNRTVEKIRPMVTVSRATASAPSTSSGAAKPPAQESTPSNSTAPRQQPSKQASTAPTPGSGLVWVNLDSKVYHYEGSRWYGKTKHGQYMTESDAQKAGYRPAKNEKKKE